MLVTALDIYEDLARNAGQIIFIAAVVGAIIIAASVIIYSLTRKK